MYANIWKAHFSLLIVEFDFQTVNIKLVTLQKYQASRISVQCSVTNLFRYFLVKVPLSFEFSWFACKKLGYWHKIHLSQWSIIFFSKQVFVHMRRFGVCFFVCGRYQAFKVQIRTYHSTETQFVVFHAINTSCCHLIFFPFGWLCLYCGYRYYIIYVVFVIYISHVCSCKIPYF